MTTARVRSWSRPRRSAIALAIAAALIPCATATAAPQGTGADVPRAKRAIISTDLATGLVNGWRSGPSDVDDGFATAMALNADQLDVKGIVVTWGNNDLGPEYAAAKRLLRLSGSEVPLFRGAAVKLSDPQVGWFDGRQELGGCVNDGVRYMARELNRGPAVVVAIGPLTDVACLVQNYPEAAQRITRLIALMGRSPGEVFSINGRVGLTDFNFRLDPRAAQVVLTESQVPVTFMTFSLTSSTFLPTTSLERLATRHSRVSRYVWRASQLWLTFWTDTFGTGGVDPSAEHGLHPWDQNAVYRAMTTGGCECQSSGFQIVTCGPGTASDGTDACAGHTPQTPLSSETAQLWLSPDYTGRQVTACTSYSSDAERQRFEQLALALAR